MCQKVTIIDAYAMCTQLMTFYSSQRRQHSASLESTR